MSTDAQGSERYVHGTGVAVSRDYRAFGVELGQPAMTRRTGWIGKERDHETSPLFQEHRLMDLSARRYDPMTGSFTTVDELWASFPAQHGYHYAYHDPVNFSDPSGMEPTEPISNPLKPNPGQPKPKPGPSLVVLDQIMLENGKIVNAELHRKADADDQRIAALMNAPRLGADLPLWHESSSMSAKRLAGEDVAVWCRQTQLSRVDLSTGQMQASCLVYPRWRWAFT